MQEKRNEDCKQKNDRQVEDDGRRAVTTVALVLQARAKMSANKVNGPGDTVVSEMVKQLLLEKIFIMKRFFQECFMGQIEAPSSWKMVKLVSWGNRMRSQRRGSEVTEPSRWHRWCRSGTRLVLFFVPKKKGTRELEEIARGRSWRIKLPAPAGYHEKSATKTTGMAGWTTPMLRHGGVVRPTMYFGQHGHQNSFRWGRGSSQKIWRSTIFMGGLCRLSHASCAG